MKVGFSLTKNMLAPLTTIAAAFVTDGDIKKKTSGGEVVRTRKRINIVILNDRYIAEIIKRIKLLGN